MIDLKTENIDNEIIDLKAENIDSESVRAALEQAWKDHHHTRDQTWKALQMELIMVAGLIAISWQTQNLHIILVTSLLTLVLAICGIQITKRHRNSVECLKFKHIRNCSKALGIMREELICGTGKPEPISLWDAFNPKKANTSLFILRMNFAILIFSIIYLIWIFKTKLVCP